MKPIREFAPHLAAIVDSTDSTGGVGDGNSPASTNARYFRRLLGYVWQEKRLVVLSVLFGVLGLCLPFVYPMLIGSAIDIFAKWPLVGMGFDCKQEEIGEFQRTLFFDQLD